MWQTVSTELAGWREAIRDSSVRDYILKSFVSAAIFFELGAWIEKTDRMPLGAVSVALGVLVGCGIQIRRHGYRRGKPLVLDE